MARTMPWSLGAPSSSNHSSACSIQASAAMAAIRDVVGVAARDPVHGPGEATVWLALAPE